MKFLEKFKKDKRFRVKAILITLLIIFIWSKGGEEKKEAQTFETCDQYNGFTISCLLDWYWTWEDGSTQYGCTAGDDKILCETNGCIVAEVVKAGVTNPDVCIPYALNGWIVGNVDDCKSGCSEIVGDDIICRQCGPGEEPETCNSREKSIGKILESIFPNMGCKSRYYMMIFGGGFMALIAILAVL